MSQEQVRDFFEKVETDEVLQQKLESLDKETSDEKIREASVEKIIDIAKTAGFIFTAQEFISIVTEKPRIEETKSNETASSSKSCFAAWAWDDCYKLWDIQPNECGGGVQHIPPGYQPGDENGDEPKPKP